MVASSSAKRNSNVRFIPHLLLLLCLAVSPRVQAELLPVKTYTTADGLLRDTANCIVQDSRGFLWFCTSDGLSRFDGYGFINYTTDDGLPHRVVNSFLGTRNGTYWVATNDGLARFNPKGQRASADSIRNQQSAIRNLPGPMFVTYRPQDNEASKAVEVLFEDAQGKLWCGTDGGLYWVEERDGKVNFHRVDLPKAKASLSSAILAIAEDPRGGLWVGSDGQGLYRLADGRIENYTDKNGLPITNVTSLLADRNGHVWVGMSTNGGVCELVADPDPKRAVVSRCYTKRDGLAENWIRNIYQTSDGKLWISTTNGITTFNQPEANDESPFHIYKDAQGLCDGEAWAVREDRDGNIWVSTTCGIKKITHSGFVRFTQADGLASLFVNSIFTSHAGELFVITKHLLEMNDRTTEVHSINRYDRGRFTFVTPRLPPKVSTGWGGGQIVLQDKAGDWWLPGDKQAVFRFPQVENLSQLANAKPQVINIPDKEVFRLYEDSRGDVWISTMYSGSLLRRERSSETMRDYKNEVPGKGVATCFAEDSAGNLWIGFDYGEAKLVRYREGRFTLIATDETRASGGMTSLYFDQGGRLWFTSRVNGVGRIDDPSASPLQVIWYNRKKGLATDGTACLVEDKFGRIYVGHGRGVDRIEPGTGQIKHYTTTDGLPQGAIPFAARDSEGSLWFGGYGGGLARLIPEAEKPRQVPNILLTGLRVAGVAQAVSELGETSLPKLSLDSNQTQVSIDFLGLGASLGEDLKYQYKLEGAGHDWIETTQRTIDLANLAPGSYRFQVRAVTFDNMVSQTPATISFKIAPPIWQRWWFIALTILFTGGVTYWSYRYRLNRLLEVERVRTRIASDLHDDIGANLTKIAVLSEVANQQISSGLTPTDGAFTSVARIARESVASMSDIVWAVNPQRDTLRDLAQRMRRFAADTFTSRNIAFSFRAPAAAEDTRMGADLRRQIYLIFKESVNNIVRHAACTQAEIEISRDGAHLVLRIHDNGRGFEVTQASDGNGLASMRRRAHAVQGTLEIVSGDGAGTTVSLTIPVARRSWFARAR